MIIFSVFDEATAFYGTQIFYNEEFRRLGSLIKSGRRSFGVEIEMKEKIQKKSQYKTRLYTTKSKRKGKLLNPKDRMVSYLDKSSKLQLRPEKDYFGETEIFLRPVVKGWNGGNYCTGNRIVTKKLMCSRY